MVWHCGPPGLLGVSPRKLQALAVGDTSVLTQNVSLAVGLRRCLSHRGLWGWDRAFVRSRKEADTVIPQEEQVRG